jgi:leader peptidase (prepilin peptidase)/N-methyltransferase
MFPIQELPRLFQALLAFPFGLIIGSFLNVVIYRVPRGESVTLPASHCGSCGTPVKPYDNIPVLSYLLLRGRCRSCRAPISWLYPAVELLTGLLFAALAYKSGITGLGIAEMIFVALMLCLICTDYRHKLLPNVITYPAFLAMLVFAAWRLTAIAVASPSWFFTTALSYKVWLGAGLLAAGAVSFYLVDVLDHVLFSKYLDVSEAEEEEDELLKDVDEERLIRQHDLVIYATMILGIGVAVVWGGWGTYNLGSVTADPVWFTYAFESLFATCLGALVGGGLIWLLRAIYFYTRGIGGMGLGDVKMMAIIGGFLGWQRAFFVLFFGTVMGALVGLLLIALMKNQKGMKAKLPFGVFLGIAAIFAVFFGQGIIVWYAGMLRP